MAPDIAPDVLAALEAMARPDPQPPSGYDTFQAALGRRIRSRDPERRLHLAELLRAHGFADPPEGQVPSDSLRDLTAFITPIGWRMLGRKK